MVLFIIPEQEESELERRFGIRLVPEYRDAYNYLRRSPVTALFHGYVFHGIYAGTDNSCLFLWPFLNQAYQPDLKENDRWIWSWQDEKPLSIRYDGLVALVPKNIGEFNAMVERSQRLLGINSSRIIIPADGY